MSETYRIEIIKVKARISELDKTKGEGLNSTYYWERRKDLITKLNYWLKRYGRAQIKQVTEQISTSFDEE